MTNDASWWNFLIDLVAVQWLQALIPFVLAGILAFALLAIVRGFKRLRNHPSSPE